jgi:2'-5' RNA ligase
MPRLFTGLEIPSPIAARLAGLRAGLEGARWIDPENYHVTLRFLGDVDDVVASDFAAELAHIEARSFELVLDGLGSFGGKRPRSVWANVVSNDGLLGLQRAHERAARAVGLAPEPRNFKPHMTLARLRNVQARDVAVYLENNGAFLAGAFPVRRFALYSARASSGGGPYVVEDAFDLRAD